MFFLIYFWSPCSDKVEMIKFNRHWKYQWNNYIQSRKQLNTKKDLENKLSKNKYRGDNLTSSEMTYFYIEIKITVLGI